MSVAMVTGPNSGIGLVIARSLAERGYHLVAAGRSETRIAPVVAEIKDSGGSAEFLHLDLASLDSAKAAAVAFEKTGRTLDVLVNNAGIGVNRRGLTKDGFEVHFGINHLGHFMLTHHLRHTFRPGTRIVQVASSVHDRAPGIDFDLVRRKSSFAGLNEYAVSKLANVLFVREMARRQPDWRLYAVHPGLVSTNLIPGVVRFFYRNRILTPEQGADTALWCATSDDVADESGNYYAKRETRTPSPVALDYDLADELWRRSELWCGVTPQQ